MRSRKVRSRARGRAIVGVALMALLGSACSTFSPKAEVQTKQVAIDLAFGAKVDPNVVTEDPVLRPVESGPVDLPDAPERPGPLTFTEPDLCPPPSAVSPKYIAPPRIRRGKWDPEQPNDGNAPPEDKFLFRFSGNRANEAFRETFEYKTIDEYGNDILPGSGFEAFHYRVSNKVNGVNMWFSVVPTTEAIDAQGGTADGLFLKEIEIPRFGSSRSDASLGFKPASGETVGGLKIFDFPITSGNTIEDRSGEVYGKDPVPVPGAPVFRSSGNALSSRVSVGKREVIPVCDQLAQAWKITWEISSVGEYPFQLTGIFYMGTHIGGWPLKEDYVLFSEDDKLISGNFSSNMARLDPGDYL